MANSPAAPWRMRGRILVALFALSIAAGAHAQDAGGVTADSPGQAAKAPAGQKGGAGQPSAADQRRLPPDSTTKHTLALPGRTLSFTAVAGSIRLFDDKGEPQADVAYTSYQLDGADRGARPVTFFFNGGPGASSAWLQLGDAGPWRLSITARAR